MKTVKRVYFEAEGEKERLTELARQSKSVNTFALTIEREFELNFGDAMFIANYWFNLIQKQQ